MLRHGCSRAGLSICPHRALRFRRDGVFIFFKRFACAVFVCVVYIGVDKGGLRGHCFVQVESVLRYVLNWYDWQKLSMLYEKQRHLLN